MHLMHLASRHLPRFANPVRLHHRPQLYAIVPTVYELRDLQDGWELPTLQGQPVTVRGGGTAAPPCGVHLPA